MMRNLAQTIGILIDKAPLSYLGWVNREGFPEIKAMLPPRQREGIHRLYFTTNASSMRVAHYWENPTPASISATGAFSEALCFRALWRC